MSSEILPVNTEGNFAINGEECDCFEVTCPVCGQSPIVIPVATFLDGTVHECPSCDMIFRYSSRH